jgi:hypothetical protein
MPRPPGKKAPAAGSVARRAASATGDSAGSASAGTFQRPAEVDETLRRLAARRGALADEVRRCDLRVFQLESRYLDMVCYGRPGYIGSLMDGWGRGARSATGAPANPTPATPALGTGAWRRQPAPSATAAGDSPALAPLKAARTERNDVAAASGVPSTPRRALKDPEPLSQGAASVNSPTARTPHGAFAAAGSGAATAAGEWRYPPSLRIFSLSSATALATCEEHGLAVA